MAGSSGIDVARDAVDNENSWFGGSSKQAALIKVGYPVVVLCHSCWTQHADGAGRFHYE